MLEVEKRLQAHLEQKKTVSQCEVMFGLNFDFSHSHGFSNAHE